jgi:integrase
MQNSLTSDTNRAPWNRGKMMGQKPPLKRNEIWAIRTRLQIAGQIRNLALFNLAIDSKLRAGDLVGLRVRDVTQGPNIANRAIVMQRKTKRPVQFEITEQTRTAIGKLISTNRLEPNSHLFTSRC